MVYKEKFRKKYYLGLLADGWSLWPMLGGAFVLGVGAIISAPIWTLVGFGSALFGVGVLGFRLFWGCESIAKKAQEEIESEEREQKEADRDLLDELLSADRDPRTQDLWRRVRDLDSQLNGDQVWKSNLDGTTVARIELIIQEMFEECEKYLRQTLEIRGPMRSSRSDKLRRVRQEQIDGLIDAVEQTINELEEVATKLIGYQNEGDQLSSLNIQLQKALVVGERVREKMNGLKITD